MGDHITNGGGPRRWRTRWRTLLTTTTLLSQRVFSFAAVVGALPGKPYWSRVGTDSRVGGDNRGGAAPGVPRLLPAPRLEGEEVEGATPSFLALVRHRARGRWCHAYKATISPPLAKGRSLHSYPWREGHRVGQEAEAAALNTGGAQHAHETPTQAATTPTRSESKQTPSRNIAKATFGGWSATERRVPAFPSIPTFRHGCEGNGLDCNAIVV